MSNDNYHRQLGWTAAAMRKSDLYCRYPVACLDLWIRPAIQLGQIHFFFDRTGGLRGDVTWAFLSAEVECAGRPRRRSRPLARVRFFRAAVA
ncbi:MAG TPA: hypothetical protein VM555_11305 [Tahibacter sp.]|nr:hypothetical protein [Tahibacter sp.]